MRSSYRKCGLVWSKSNSKDNMYGKIKSHIRLLKIYNIKGGKLFPPFIFFSLS